MNQNSRELWRGPSLIDGQQIVVLASGYKRESVNAKTGDMLQVYILRVDISPLEASQTGADVSICGQCILRPILVKLARKTGTGNTVPCYVDKVRGPQGVWKSMKAGNIAQVTPHEAGILANKPIRLGAYGEPAAVPVSVWVELLKAANGKHTAYTHQWRSMPELRPYAMASIDPDDDDGLREAQALKWRTYRILADGEQPQAGEIMCPEKTRGAKCADCGLCAGTNNSAKSITIPAIK